MQGMASTSWFAASLALPWVLLVPGCGGTSDDNLFNGQARGPAAESPDVDSGSQSGSGGLEGVGGSVSLPDPAGTGGAGGVPEHPKDGAGGGTAGAAAHGAGGDHGGAGGAGPNGAADAGPACTPTRFYLDADGDGFGDPKRFSEACDKPSGHVTNSEDCYDGNKDAHPGQTAMFSVERGDGSFDYDCDGHGTPMDTTVGHCGTFPFCSGSPGWKTASPTCGVSETWLDSCTGLTAICGQKTETRVQQCL